MIGYRFLSAAEEEMIAAAFFYEAAAVGLGKTSLRMFSKPLKVCDSIQNLVWNLQKA